MPRKKAALSFSIIRRAEAALCDYKEGRLHLARFVRCKDRISLYFLCLRRFESAIAMLYQAIYHSIHPLKVQYIDENPDSPYDRIRVMYNIARHDDSEQLPERHLHAVWVRNDGLYAVGDTNSAHVTFSELCAVLREVAAMAETLSQGRILDRGVKRPSEHVIENPATRAGLTAPNAPSMDALPRIFGFSPKPGPFPGRRRLPWRLKTNSIG